MKKLMLFAALLSLTSLGWAESAREDSIDRLQNAGKVLNEIMSAPDKGIPEEVIDHAKCIAVVPHMIKGGLVFGAEHTWSAGRSPRLAASPSCRARLGHGGGSPS